MKIEAMKAEFQLEFTKFKDRMAKEVTRATAQIAQELSQVGDQLIQACGELEQTRLQLDMLGKTETPRSLVQPIPPCTLDALRLRCTRGISREDQWHEIWVILFGTLDTSPKPLLHGVVKEITGIIRDIWSKDDIQIISSCLQARGMPIGPGQLLSLLSEFLDRVEERFERKPPERNKNEQTPNTGKAVMAAKLGGTDYFHLSSTNFEPPSDQVFHAPGSDPLTTPLLDRESPMPVSSIRDSYGLQPAGVVLQSQVHHWEHNLDNLSTSSELFNETNLLDLPEYPYDLLWEGLSSQELHDINICQS
ncbi:hypothetical protein H9L39_16980 [Fusarium oxysporum f. sp. albedinis]|nr:hypothetical protein H9L39_16980 [Fusarium oxysporum f. sp. albedinis]